MTDPKVPVHIWLQDLRDKARLSQSEVDLKTRQLGGRVSQSYLSQIEKGYKSLEAMEPPRMDALRQVYGVSVEEWARRTGLTIVTSESQKESSERARSTNPVRELWPNLALAIEEYGDRARYREMATPEWRDYLNTFDFYDGHDLPPEGWAELFLTLKQSNVRPGEE